MNKDKNHATTLEIISKEKSFYGKYYHPEIVNEIVKQFQIGGGICLITGKEPYHQEEFYSDEIINVFVNGFRLEETKKTKIAGYKIFDVSNFSEIEISKTNEISTKEGYNISGTGRLSITEKVRQWATVRNLDTANPKSQLLKGFEELSELSVGVNKQQEEKIIDSMGDIQVVLIILAQQLGIDYEKSLEYAYEQIKDRKGMMIDGTFIKYADLSEENKKILDNEEN